MGHLFHVSGHAVRQLATRPRTPVDVLPERQADQDRRQRSTGNHDAGNPACRSAGHQRRRAGQCAGCAAQAQLISFSTDVYNGEIDTRGGTLSKLSLVKQGNGKQPDLVITLFDHTAEHTYLARTGLLGGDFPNHTDIYTPVPNQPHDLTGDAKSFQLSFESPVKGGVKVIKTYTFTRGSYVIGVDTKIDNVGTAPVTPSVYMELVRDDTPVETPRFSHTFIGPAVYTDQHHFQKMTFSDIDKNKEDFVDSADNGWIAMVQHYFASAWIPQQGVEARHLCREDRSDAVSRWREATGGDHRAGPIG